MIPDGYTIKSKRTNYGGVVFRSRHEARWAVFMDCLGVKYLYEPECYEVEINGRIIHYRPDFYLPEFDCNIEIKPREPNEKELTSAAGLSNDIRDVFIFWDLSPKSGIHVCDCKVSLNTWMWCECPRCLKIDICDGGLPECSCYSDDEFDAMEKCLIPDVDFSRTKNIINAFKLSRAKKVFDNAREKTLNRRPSLY